MRRIMKLKKRTIPMLGLVISSLFLGLLATIPDAAEAGPVKKIGTPSPGLTADVVQMGVEAPVTVVARGKAGLSKAEKDELKAALKRGEALVIEKTSGQSMSEVTGIAVDADLWVVRRHETLPFQVLMVVAGGQDIMPNYSVSAPGPEGEAQDAPPVNEKLPPGAKPNDLRPESVDKDARAAARYKPAKTPPSVLKVNVKQGLQRALGAKNWKQAQSDLAAQFLKNTTLDPITAQNVSIRTRAISDDSWYFAHQVLDVGTYWKPDTGTQVASIDVGYFIEQFASDQPKNKWISVKTVGYGVSSSQQGVIAIDNAYHRGWFQEMIRVEYGFADTSNSWNFVGSLPYGWKLDKQGPPNANNDQNLTYSTSTSWGVSGTGGFQGSDPVGTVTASYEVTTTNSHSVNIKDWKVENNSSPYKNQWDFKMSAVTGAAYDPISGGKSIMLPAGSPYHCTLRGLPDLSKKVLVPDTAAVYRGPYDNTWIPMRFQVTQWLRDYWRSYDSNTWYGSCKCGTSSSSKGYGWASYLWVYTGNVKTASGG